MFPNIRQIYTIDGTYIRNYFYAIMFGLWGIDSAYEMVYLVMELYYDGDYENTGTKFSSFFKYIFPTINDSNNYIVDYEDKGFLVSRK